MRSWLLLVLGVVIMAAEPAMPMTRTAGVIVDGAVHIVVTAPPFLACYASEVQPVATVFECPVAMGAVFDYDVAAGQLYVIGARDSRPPDDRPRLTRYAIPAGLSSTVSTVTAKNGRILHGLTADAGMDPELFTWERVDGLPMGSGWGLAVAVTVDGHGAITIGAASPTQARVVRRLPMGATASAVTTPSTPRYTAVGEPVAIGAAPVALLRIGSMKGLMLIAGGVASQLPNGFAPDAPGSSSFSGKDLEVIVDKDANRSWLISGATAPALTGLEPADVQFLRRHEAVLTKARQAIAETQKALGYRAPAAR